MIVIKLEIYSTITNKKLQKEKSVIPSIELTNNQLSKTFKHTSHMKKQLFSIALILSFISPFLQARQKQINLFNGTDLKGWHADVPAMDKDASVKSPFLVRNGLLVSMGTPGGHLITDSIYSNYRLEVEYRFAGKPGNCGVLVNASTPRALYGMFPKSIEVQMEHKNAGDFWCIAEDIKVPDMETRRGPQDTWGTTEGKNRRIENLTENSEKPVGEWNRMVIECRGREIKVWVNDDLVNYGFDCTADKGKIALQAEGSEVEFRKLLLTPFNEKWVSLFNGKDLSGWKVKIAGHEVNDNYLETFRVEDGMIRVIYDKYNEFKDLYGHLYYEKPFSYYKLKCDYRFTGTQLKGGATWNNRNSGIMLHSQSAESNNINQAFPVSLEFQLLGGLGNGPRSTANVCTPGTAVELKGKVDYSHCVNSTSKTYNGDQWVHVEAVVMGDEYMTFLVNGDTVLTFQRPQIGGGFISKEMAGKDWDQMGITDKQIWLSKEGTTLKEGYIALQSESHAVDFKNIELLNLIGCKDPKAKNYKAYCVKSDDSDCIY